jgi:tetratricopeptide (TPR) repeat protein
MKATNLRQQRHRLQLQQEERKLNNIVFCLHQKAGIIACLFLFLAISTNAQEWHFDENTQKAYELVLNLQTEEARILIPSPKTPQEHYVMSLAEALELLVTEDAAHYEEYEDRFEALLDRKTKLTSAEDLFLQAEIGLQWAFVHLKFGHEFDAALNLRQAFHTTQEIKKRFPKFTAVNKTSGLLEVIVGSVPEKYTWVLELLNIEGSTEIGLEELETIRKSDHVLSFESELLYAVTQGFVLQRPDIGLQTVREQLAERPKNRLALFIGASLAMKNAQGTEALSYLTTLEHTADEMPIYYAEYLKGEIYLQKAEYLNSISSFRWFINHYKGQNYIKDAYYKIGLCYWLNGNISDAHHLFEQASRSGRTATEADRYAASSMSEIEEPNVKLTKIRFSTDGGFYDDAKRVIADVKESDLPTKRDKVEFAYRRARLAHKTNDIMTAKKYYRETIELSGQDNWYYAPNSWLQLGYIGVEEKDPEAATYFSRALEYKKHEYKNSIDTKAKSALAQLKKRK